MNPADYQPPNLKGGFDPDSQKDMTALYRAMEWSRWKLQPFRTKQLQLYKEFVGFNYSDSGADDKVPVNLIHLTHNVLLRRLAPKSPRMMCSTQRQDSKPVAALMEAWMNKAAAGMNLRETISRWVSNALFGLGCLKVGQAQLGMVEFSDGTRVPVGQPFAEAVAEDDRVHDMTARSWDQIQYAGNRYRVPLYEAANNPLFTDKARTLLSEMTYQTYNERGDLRLTTLSQSTQGYIDEFVPHCELWDLYLPKERVVVTVAYESSVQGGVAGGVPLRVMDWKGPKSGPYLTLAFVNVNNQVMPVSPLSILLDMHTAGNRAWRKLIRQIERQKVIYGVRGTATADGERVVRASDGEAIRMDNPDAVVPFQYPGADQGNLVAVEQIRNIFSWLAGNLDVMGGLSPQSQTLGQDQLLAEGSSLQVSEMVDRATAAVKVLGESIGYWWWKNPVLTYHTSIDVEGEEVPAQLSPQMRQIPFEDLEIDIDPYSLQHSTPQTRLQGMMQLLTQLLLPASPQMQQQGAKLKWPAIVGTISKLMDSPDVADWIEFGPPPDQQAPMQMAQEGMQEAAKMPANTTRTNVRVNRPGMSQDGMGKVMQMMAGGAAQPKQGQMAGRMIQ